MNTSTYVELLGIRVNCVKGTEHGALSYEVSKLHGSSIIPSIELLLVHYEEGHEGLFREKKEIIIPFDKSLAQQRQDEEEKEKGRQ
jgi:hypothetical protein